MDAIACLHFVWEPMTLLKLTLCEFFDFLKYYR